MRRCGWLTRPRRLVVRGTLSWRESGFAKPSTTSARPRASLLAICRSNRLAPFCTAVPPRLPSNAVPCAMRNGSSPPPFPAIHRQRLPRNFAICSNRSIRWQEGTEAVNEGVRYRCRQLELPFPHDQLPQVNLPDSGQMIKAVRMAGEDQYLQASCGRVPGGISFGSQADDVENTTMLAGVCMG